MFDLNENGIATRIKINFEFVVANGSLHKELNGRSIVDVPLGELLSLLSKCAPSAIDDMKKERNQYENNENQNG